MLLVSGVVRNIFKIGVSIALTILIFALLIKLDQSYAISSFISIFGGLSLNICISKNYLPLYEKLTLILIVSLISVPIQNLYLQVFDFRLRFSQLITIVCCYIMYAILVKYVNWIYVCIRKVCAFSIIVQRCILLLYSEIKKIERTICIQSVCFISFSIYFLWILINVELRFPQFSFLRILFVAFVFLILLIFMLGIFQRDILRFRLDFNITNILFSIPIIVIFIIFTSSILLIHMSPDKGGFPFLILQNADAGVWNVDSAFHVSLIQSIINFGYPSIAENNTPLLVYHVLSHYVDAILVIATGLEAYDSYGLFFWFKIFLYLSSIMIFILSFNRNGSYIVFTVCVLLMGLLLTDYWGNAVASEALWFTTVLILLSFKTVINSLLFNEYDLKKFLFITLFIVIVAIGKISTGFMYASFVGILLLFRFPKNKYVYISGIIWVVFFYVFDTLMTSKIAVAECLYSGLIYLSILLVGLFYISKIQRRKLYLIASILAIFICGIYLVVFRRFEILYMSIETISLFKRASLNLLYPDVRFTEAYVLLFVIFIQNVLFKKYRNINIFFSSLISLFVMSLIFGHYPNFGYANRMYFEIGLNSVLTMVIIYNLIAQSKSLTNNASVKFISIILLFVLCHNYIATPQKMVVDIPSMNYMKYSRPDDKSTLYNFRQFIYKYMRKKNLSKTNSVLYIPKEVFQTELKKYQRTDIRNWPEMLIYAVNGIPLIYGVHNLGDTYGLKDYDSDSLWRSKKDFNISQACKVSDHKNIIVVDSYKNRKVELIRCRSL
ncbi:hypothetical protein [Francisella sp. 19X1-34]|uniref:hypothetical protein n=1 Tax=Francisella sp. 19X1-34 TaxID=3087177 RepID=UPI002E2FAD5B|nr:hypothetical protein [Francisella sp. 19X1-34]MED7787524.1 hypothetical protein [Francisella sp. 19X1-34]